VDTLSFKTVSANKATVNKEWLIIDATGLVLGRLASTVARILRGKHKTNFTPHVDCGDYVIVINAEKVVLTGAKLNDKEYVRHSGYPGGQSFRTAKEILVKFPERLVEHAVKGMLPKNRLGRSIYKNMKVVVGPTHKYEAQQPKLIDLNTIK
jgi:large subunit ribosomal protein L13